MQVDSSSPDSYQWERARATHGDGGDFRDSRDPREPRDPRTPARRNRLFKTRAETKRNQNGPPSGCPPGPQGPPAPPGAAGAVQPHRGRSRPSPSASPTNRRRHPGHPPRNQPRDPPALQRSLSTPEFQVSHRTLQRNAYCRLLNITGNSQILTSLKNSDWRSLFNRKPASHCMVSTHGGRVAGTCRIAPS